MADLADIERDGADARAHGYGLGCNPYRHGPTMPAPFSHGNPDVIAAWDRGWRGPDAWDDADRANHAGMIRAGLAAAATARAARRDSQPMPVGSLFDEVSRAQRELFS